MLSKLKYCTPVFCLFLLLAYCTAAWAQDMQAIKQRMVERKPAIDALKNQGVIGEGMDGYLHIRQQAGNAAALVREENSDRRTVNRTIAQREGTTEDVVARKAAAKIINSSPPGHWIMKPDGTWYRK